MAETITRTGTTGDRPGSSYDPADVEARWLTRWEESRLYHVEDATDRPNWFALTMYPYPSGILHMGHWYAFSVPDAFARYKRMRGFNVMFPMGFDAFGLPAENAAIRNNIHPATWTYDNIAKMREQYRAMGTMIDWDREVISSDPGFYRWNQWFFLRMLERGLAYRKNGAVWWCPNDQTVLANEQVLDGNVCERCGFVVIRRDLEQWYLRITDYAEELLREAEDLDWPERVKTMQRNWIGRSEGARLRFDLAGGDPLEVFTTHPETVWGATFMVLAPEHPAVAALTTPEKRAEVEAYAERARGESEIERTSLDESRPKTGVFTGGHATNPVTGEPIPVWIADYVLMGYGTGAIMAVPAHDIRDFAFARAHGLPIRPVIQPVDRDALDGETMTEAYVGPGTMVDSGPIDGLRMPDQMPKVLDWVEANGRGHREVTYRLRDWLISRQRYWGTPFPIIYCEACGIVPVPDADLPVVLPLDAEFTPTGQSPLVSNEAFVSVPCPSCGGPGRRETDTMDTFVDSSWYWYRYTSPGFDAAPFDRERVEAWTPVDLYCGGIEHAILHLLYARFWTKVTRDLGLIDHGEPFVRLRNQGMILSTEGTKMSKSRGSQVGPDELVAAHGADSLRLHLMYLGPWDQGGPWNDRGITGMERFIRRAYQVVEDATSHPQMTDADPDGQAAIRRLTHLTIARVTADIEAYQVNTMVAALIEFTNALFTGRHGEVAATSAWREAAETLVLLMAPSTPFVAEEMWSMLGKPYSVHTQTWPESVEAYLHVSEVEIVVQVNGKVRDRVVADPGVDEASAVALAMASERVRSVVGGEPPKRVIYVPGKLVNIVV
ncbi:MAG: leucine--tRNA ligase [Chloroflexota bacterium]|nr:leucine--tRNA ligase [Chloroflexota bacterium]